MVSDTVCYCAAARQVARQMSLFYDKEVSRTGLSIAQYAIVAEIDRRSAPPPTIKELAAALIMDRSTLGQNLRPLRRDGLVELVANDQDGRSRRVTLSTRGRKKFIVTKKLWTVAQREYAALIGQETADHARHVMKALVDALRC